MCIRVAITTLLLTLVVTAPAGAEERITLFSSDITVNTDASLDVTETIAVISEGQQIQRGIYRDFPTMYKDRLGNRIRVNLDVLNVTRDGAAEQFALENLSNGVRIRIGRAEYFLDNGAHEYQIRYRTRRQIGYFENYDELYWNVTGNGWDFAIEKAEAKLTLPVGARIIQDAAYTGLAGATGGDFHRSIEDNVVYWNTTRELNPYEGLTIAAGWPKGAVLEPSKVERANWFLRDNATTGVAMLGALLVLIYYWVTWRRYGQDPPSGTIIPLFRPPKGLSPAAARFIRLMSFDRTAFSAALINMGVKGYLNIDNTSGNFYLRRESDADLNILSNGERRIAERLLVGRDSIELDNEHHALFRTSIASLRESLATEYEQAFFVRNTGLFVIGLLLTLAIMLVPGLIANRPERFIAAVAIAFIAALPMYVVLHFWGDDKDPTFKPMPFKAIPLGNATMFAKLMLFFTIAWVSSGFAVLLDIASNPIQAVCYSLLGALNITFFFLLKRPTRAGRSIMDEIEGFRMYLKTAEEARLNMLNPPDKTPELFEKWLPYALALDVENEWSKKFTAVLAAASAERGQSGWHPRWYSGNDWHPGRAGLFSKSLGASLGAAVAASASPPGSSSGSGGGGSSGGGGGGGGGGGW